MPKVVFSVKGTDKLASKLRRNQRMNELRRIVKENADELELRMKKNTGTMFTGTRDYDGRIKPGTPTGATKRSIIKEERNNGLTYLVYPQTPYAGFVNFGTRFMEARPFVSDAVIDQRRIFEQRLRRVVR